MSQRFAGLAVGVLSWGLLFLPRAEAVELDVAVGFQGLMRGEWTTLRARCSLEAGEAPIENGRLVLDFPGYAVGRCEAPIELQPGREVTLRLTVPVLVGENYVVRIVDAAGKTRVKSEPVDGGRNVDAARLVLLLARQGLGMLGNKKLKDPPRVAHIDVGELPRDLRPLRSVSAIVIPLGGAQTDADLIDLLRDRDRIAQLRAYVERGGRLVLTARPGHPRVWVGTPLESLMPVKNPRPTSLSAADVKSVLGELSKESTQLSVVQTELIPGARWVHQQGKIGLQAERRLGRGWVTFLAFDPDDKGVREAAKLGQLMLDATTRKVEKRRTIRPRTLRRVARDALAAKRPIGPLGFGLLAAAVLLHVLLLGPLTMILSRRNKRSPWGALLIPPLLSLVLAVVIVIVGALTRPAGEVRMLQFTTQDPVGQGDTVSQVEVGVFASHDGKITVELPERWLPALSERSPLDALQFRERPPALHFVEGVPVEVGPLAIAARSVTQLRFEGEAPRLPIEVVHDDKGILITSLAKTGRIEQLVGLRMELGQTRIELLPPLAAGASIRWDPARSPSFDLEEKLSIEADPFETESGRQQLLLKLAERIVKQNNIGPSHTHTQRRRRRSRRRRRGRTKTQVVAKTAIFISGKSGKVPPTPTASLPATWILHVDPAAPPALKIKGWSASDGGTQALRVTIIPLETGK